MKEEKLREGTSGGRRKSEKGAEWKGRETGKEYAERKAVPLK